MKHLIHGTIEHICQNVVFSVFMHSVFIFVSKLYIQSDHGKVASCLGRLLCGVFVLESRRKNVRWTEIPLKIMLSSSQSINHGKSKFPIIFVTSKPDSTLIYGSRLQKLAGVQPSEWLPPLFWRAYCLDDWLMHVRWKRLKLTSCCTRSCFAKLRQPAATPSRSWDFLTKSRLCTRPVRIREFYCHREMFQVRVPHSGSKSH